MRPVVMKPEASKAVALRGDPARLLERTMKALGEMDAAELDELRAEAEAMRDVPVDVALRCARRAAELQVGLDELLRTTESSLTVLRRVRAREEATWDH